jgi:RHS repeat-associated protein
VGFGTNPQNQLRFTGEYQDSSTSNPLGAPYYLRARRYMSSINAFTQTDPMPYGVGSLYEGPYTYANNSPLRFTDPTGLRATECNTSVGRQAGIVLLGLLPGRALSYCEAVAADKALNPLQAAGTIATASSCALAFGPAWMVPGSQGYLAGLAAGCGAIANNFMTNQRSGQSGGYWDSFSSAAAEGYLTTPSIGPPATKPGVAALPDEMAATFRGSRYTSRVLTEDTVLYRAGTADQPLGQFFSAEKPVGVIQTRIDKAIPPVWPGGQAAPLDTGFAVVIPKGTTVFEGVIANQGGWYTGGTGQIVVQKPWTISGVKVVDSWGLK